ncbi:MAG: ABC transporter permease [Methanobrevibacter sp.]|jgi:lipopolysaccharide transport system permease protein|nr:ABC transporter permease [Methanobrevibacter sp.]
MINHRFFANFKKYRFLLFELIKKNLTVKYKDSVLGVLWSLINPALSSLVLAFVFGFFFGSSIENFVIYVLIGYITYNFFSTATKGAMNSIKGGASILKKIYVPKYIYPLSITLTEIVNYLISMIVLVIFMIVTACPFSIYNLLAILPIILLCFFAFGCGLILASIYVFFRDIKYLYNVFTQLLMYGSAIFYDISTRVPDKYKMFFNLNPVYCAISNFRDTILYAKFPNLYLLEYQAITALIVVVVGLIVFYKTQNKFILHL